MKEKRLRIGFLLCGMAIFLSGFSSCNCYFPQANFSASPRQGPAPLEVQFKDESVSSCEIICWNWDFGDGCSSDQSDPIHTYYNIGRYNVSLTIKTEYGASRRAHPDYIRVSDEIVVTTTTSVSPDKEALSLESLGNFQFLLKVNLANYSQIDINQASVIGWLGDWDNLIPMAKSGKSGWAEVTLLAPCAGVYSFCVCNRSKDQWLWLDLIDHDLVAPNIWINPNADPNEKVLAFIVEDEDNFDYLSGPIDITTTISATTTTVKEEALKLEVLGDWQFRLQANLADYSHIEIAKACIVGWEGDWDNLIYMEAADTDGWVEAALKAEKSGVKSFCVTDKDKAQWLWMNLIAHPLVAPNIWINPNAQNSELVLAFMVDSADKYRFLSGPVYLSTTTTSQTASTSSTTTSVASVSTTTSRPSTTTTSVDNRPVAVYFEPQEIEAGINTQFEITMKVTDIDDIFGANGSLNFDSAYLKYVDFRKGDLLDQGCSSYIAIAKEQNRILFGSTRLGISCGGVSGPGTIVTFIFQSLARQGATEIFWSDNFFCILDAEEQCNWTDVGRWEKIEININ